MTLEELGQTPAIQSDFDELRNPDLVLGRVIRADKGGCMVATGDDERLFTLPKSMRKGEVRPVTGDWVAGDNQDVIRKILPRRGVLERQASGPGEGGQLLACHVDMAMILTALNKNFNLARIERYMALCAQGDVAPVILLSKSDLDPDFADKVKEVLTAHPGAKVQPFSNENGQGLDEVRELLIPGKTAVLLGSSGAGKSTLVNTLSDEDLMDTDEVRQGDDKGRHTTTHRELLMLPWGALVIDSPGLREVGLRVDEEAVDAVFDDLMGLAQECRFHDCRHITEPGCRLRKAVEDEELEAGRLDSYLKLKVESEQAAIRKVEHLRREEQKKRTQNIKAVSGKLRRPAVHKDRPRK